MATIRDVAREAGISPGAVSRILNNDVTLSVAPETRQKVFAAAEKLNYTKTAKQTTPSKSTFNMGIVLWFSSFEDQKDPYYINAVQGAQDFCNKNSIQLTKVSMGDADYKERLKSVNGLICIGKFSDADVKSFIQICKNVVFLDMEVDKYSITSLSMDFEQAVYAVLNYLTELGHERIAFLGGREYVGNNELIVDPRAYYFKKYMNHRKIPYKPFFKEGVFNPKSGYEMMNEIIKGGELPTAVFAASDAIAFGAMKAIAENGLKIPQDISLVGFNDDETSAFMNPPLTTIHAPSYDMGQHGANLVYVASNLCMAAPLRAKIPCSLIIRESCRKL